jgi:microcystin-dependent protein
VSAGKDDMNGTAAGRLTTSFFGGVATNLGSVGGAESQTLALSQLPTGIHSSGNNGINVGTSANLAGLFGNSWGTQVATASGSNIVPNIQGGGSVSNVSSMSGTNNIGVTSDNTGGGAHANVQPTIVCNYIMRII